MHLDLEERLIREVTAECDAHLGWGGRFGRRLEPLPLVELREAAPELRAWAAAFPAGTDREAAEAGTRIFLVEAATMPGQLPPDLLLAPTDLLSHQLHLSAPVRGPDVFRGMVRTLELRLPGRDTPLLALPLRADWPTL